MADQIAIALPKSVYNEGSTVTFTAVFRDRATSNESIPTTVEYKLFGDNGQRTIKAWSTLVPASSVTVTIDSGHNKIFDKNAVDERIELVVAIDRGLSTQVIKSAFYKIRNIAGASNISDLANEIEAQDNSTAAIYGYRNGDIRLYGAVDGASLNKGIAAAIAAGHRELVFSQNYEVIGSTTAIFEVPRDGIKLVSENGAKIITSGQATLMDVPILTDDIEIIGLTFEGVGTGRVTVATFQPTTVMRDLIIRDNHFNNNARLLWEGPLTTNPDSVSWGINSCVINNNHFENHNSRFINFSNVPVNFASYSKNTHHNLGTMPFYWATGGNFPNEMGFNHQKQFEIMRNDITNDDDFWSDDIEGSYLGLCLVQGYSVKCGYNTIKGLKTRDATGKDFCATYLSATHVHEFKNTYINCGNNGGTGEEAIMIQNKAYPTIGGVVGSLLYEGNTYQIDDDYFSDQGEDSPIWHFWKIAERKAVIRNNVFDVPVMKSAGDTNTASVFHSLRFNGNYVRVSEELISSCLLRVDQKNDDSTDVFDLSGNGFDLNEKTAGDANLIRTSSDHTRGDGAGAFPSVIDLSDNKIRLRGTWAGLCEATDWTTFDLSRTKVHVGQFDPRFLSSVCLLRYFDQLEIRYDTAKAGNMWPQSASIFYDLECRGDITFINVGGTNSFFLPLDINCLGATTAWVYVRCKVRQNDGDYSDGMTSFELENDGGGNLDMNFFSGAVAKNAQIPNTSEEHLTVFDVDTALTHNTDLLTGVALDNNQSPAFISFPTGHEVTMEVRKINVA